MRNEESAKQAREASEFLKRLRVTRQEAENVAKEEIERTKKLQKDEVNMHPEIIDLKKRLSSGEREKSNWERKQKDQERSYKNELDVLNREESNLFNRFNTAQSEELKLRQEQEKIEHQRGEKEQGFRNLEKKLEFIKKEEESQFIGEMEVLKRQIIDLEKRLPSGDQECNKNQLNQFENEIRTSEELRDRDIKERQQLTEKEGQAALDLVTAQQIVQEAKSIEYQKRRELDEMKEAIPHGYENAQKNYFDSEKRMKELESTHDNLMKQKESRQRVIEDKQRRIEGIRAEIKKLEQELGDLEVSSAAEYNELYDVENKINGNEYELRDAKDHVNEAKRAYDFFVQERARFGERSATLEREIVDVKRSLQEAESEERRATDLYDEIGKKCNEMDRVNENHSKRIGELDKKAMELRNSLADFERIKNEISEKRVLLNEVQSRWNEWKSNRSAPLQQELDELRGWLSLHPKAEGPCAARSTAVWNDLERVRGRIREVQQRFAAPLPVTFEEPEALRSAIKAKESDLWNRLNTRTGPVSQRFMTQLEREAEALMRAEIAATHEIKQTAIEKETSELSKLRVSLNPQVYIDDEARNRLWRSNLESNESGPIADQVLKLCQSNNITVKNK